MIRNNQLQGTPARRLALVQLARPQRARMGSIGPTPPPATAWTTIETETPDSSANWLSYVLTGQARTRQTTPGTLDYTPASATPGANVAPWNSWLTPNCPRPEQAEMSPAAEAIADYSKLFLLFGLVTAAAAGAYLLSGERS